MREILARLGISCDLPDGYSMDESRLDQMSVIVLRESQRQGRPNEWCNEHLWPGKSVSNDTVSLFFTIGNSINFRYWSISDAAGIQYCDSIKGGIRLRGADYMWRSLRLRLEETDQPFLDSDVLARMNAHEIARIFRDDNGEDVMPHLKERLENWNDLGVVISDNWNGSSYDMIHECDGSLVEFVKRSKMARAFNDPLAKMTMVNAIMHQGRGLTRFSDKIVPGIDYQLTKQLLRQGIITPPEGVTKKIAASRLLSEDEGFSLRKAALCAFVEVSEKKSIAGDLIDNVFYQNRTICDDCKPNCTKCPFAPSCAMNLNLKKPLEDTRYY